VKRPDLKIPKRPASTGYRRTERDLQHYVGDFASTLDGSGVRPPKYVDPEDDDPTIPEEPVLDVTAKPVVRRTRPPRVRRSAPQPAEGEAVPES
jgi:hypothetical protein